MFPAEFLTSSSSMDLFIYEQVSVLFIFAAMRQ